MIVVRSPTGGVAIEVRSIGIADLLIVDRALAGARLEQQPADSKDGNADDRSHV
jgi:hypothetical protein